jgi:hypothetical protein
MTDAEMRIRELMGEADDLEYGTTKAALLEEAVRLADSTGDIELGFEVRQLYMDAANFAGQIDQMLVAFSWCLAQCDRHPDQFSEVDLLWKFKWVLGHIPEFPSVRWEQIEEMLGDMTRRYERIGSTMRAIHSKRRSLAMHKGDRDAATQAHEDLLRTPRDWLSDCLACEMDSTVDYLLFHNRHQQAVEEAAPLLTGRHRCAEVPHRTYARVLWPLLRLGRVEEAMVYHQMGYRMISHTPGFVYAYGYHIDFLTLTGNLPRAIKILEKHLGDALNSPAQTWRIDFYLAARQLMEGLRAGETETIKLRLPPAFPLHRPEGQYVVSELEGWFNEQLETLAGQFDARNGNDYYRERVRTHGRMKQWAQPCPLPGKNAR